jgi:hypothetical protein
MMDRWNDKRNGSVLREEGFIGKLLRTEFGNEPKGEMKKKNCIMKGIEGKSKVVPVL